MSSLTYASLPKEVKRIGEKSLGAGFLRSLFSYGKDYSLIIKVSDGIVVGFSLYHYDVKTLAPGKTYKTGVIDCICVDTPYRREGFGSFITFSTLRKMGACGADRIEIVLKKPEKDLDDCDPGVPLEGSEIMLQSLGFRKIKEFKKVFYSMSEKKGFECAFCGQYPDVCDGILYARTSVGSDDLFDDEEGQESSVSVC